MELIRSDLYELKTNDIKKALIDIINLECTDWYRSGSGISFKLITPFIVFSDAIANRNGAKLAKFIENNKLGKVIKSSVKANPNTGHKIRVLVWEVDRLATLKWVNAG